MWHKDFLHNMNTEGIIPNYILTEAGEFTFMGLQISHNGRGRVVITDANSNKKVYSDSDYYSPSDVIGTINNIIETKKSYNGNSR